MPRSSSSRRGEPPRLERWRSKAIGLDTTQPESTGPFACSFGYRVTEQGMTALAEYQERHGRSALRKVRLPDVVAKALESEAWRKRTRQRRKQAQERGLGLVTV